MLGRLLFDQLSLGGLGQCATPGTPPCCSCTTTLCISVICPSANIGIMGATVTITGFGTCTTNSVGCCQLPGITTGSYAITVVYQGVTIFSGSRTITACHNTNIAITPVPSGFECCWNCLIPDTLHVTDANGTHSAIWSGAALSWIVCYTATYTGVTLAGPNGCGCLCSAAGAISLPIQYNLSCSATTNSLRIAVSWAAVCCVGGAVCSCGPGCPSGVPGAGYSYFGPSNGCTGLGGGFAGDCAVCTGGASNPFVDSSTVTQAWSACNPFTLSATMGAGNFTGCPVSSVAVSS